MTPLTSEGVAVHATDDERFMRLALDAARRGGLEGEVPIGAVVVMGGTVLAAACNRPRGLNDPTAHAEVLALRAAAAALSNYRLPGATLYVTLEPCPMCVGAMIQARIDRLVFGAADPKSGAVASLYRLHDDARLNHRFEVVGGVLAEDSAALLKGFFERLRQ
jgi:tRNA(adenine34) deaminase